MTQTHPSPIFLPQTKCSLRVMCGCVGVCACVQTISLPRANWKLHERGHPVCSRTKWKLEAHWSHSTLAGSANFFLPATENECPSSMASCLLHTSQYIPSEATTYLGNLWSALDTTTHPPIVFFVLHGFILGYVTVPVPSTATQPPGQSWTGKAVKSINLQLTWECSWCPFQELQWFHDLMVGQERIRMGD